MTAYAQGWLPEEVGSLANSSGSWALVAFGLALLTTGAAIAVTCGSLALLALLAGYVLGAGIQGFPSSKSLIIFWGLAAVVAGPSLGLSAHWVRSGRPTLAALGAGAVAGVLIGEGVYGLRYIADTTYPPYWWTEVAIGVVLLCAVAVHRLRHPRYVGLSVVTAVTVAIAFVGVYSQNLISLL